MDSSNTKSSTNDSLHIPHNSPFFSYTTSAASPKSEIPAYRPLPPLPTHDDGDQTANLESEDDADDELSFSTTSSVPDDEENLVIYSGVHSDEFHRYHPPQAEALRTTRSEEGLGTATFDAATPEIGIGDIDVSINHHSNTNDNISAPTPARGRPLPKVPGGRPLPPIPAKTLPPAIPGVIKPADAVNLAALSRRITSLHQSLRDATTRTSNVRTLSRIKDSLIQAQAEMIDAQGEMYRAAAEQGSPDR